MKTCKAYILGALFSLLAVSQASAQSIVGAWTIDDTTAEGTAVTVFRSDGTFFHIENALASEAPGGFDGFERGTYTWDSVTGAFTSATIQDLNGDVGSDVYLFSRGDGQDSVYGGLATELIRFGVGIAPDDVIVRWSPSGTMTLSTAA